MSERSFAEFLAALEEYAAENEADEAILLAPPPMSAGPASATASGEEAPPVAVLPNDEKARPKFCRQCGTQLQAHWRFCGRCGRPIV